MVCAKLHQSLGHRRWAGGDGLWSGLRTAVVKEAINPCTQLECRDVLKRNSNERVVVYVPTAWGEHLFCLLRFARVIRLFGRPLAENPFPALLEYLQQSRSGGGVV